MSDQVHSDPLRGDPFDLGRFVTAQASAYPQVLAELRSGTKRSHWMWYVFPQLRGLGHSSTARHFGIGSPAEAQAYLGHPLLGERLRECTRLVIAHAPADAAAGAAALHRIFGSPDDLKFRSCMTLFATVSDEASPFREALARFFGGAGDARTRALLESQGAGTP